MNLFYKWVPNLIGKLILFILLIPNLIMFFLPISNTEMSASYYGIEVNDITFMIVLYYVGFAAFYSLERRFYAYFNSKQYFILFQLLQIICCFILFKSNNVVILFAIRFVEGMLFASSVNLYMSSVMQTMKKFRAKEMTFSIFFGMLLCTSSFNNIITADILDHFSFGVLYQCAIILYALCILLVLISVSSHHHSKPIPLVQLDFGSFIWLSLILISIGYLSVYGQQYYWFESRRIILASIITVISLSVFIARNRMLKRPYISFKIFSYKQYWWGITIIYIMYIERFSFVYSGRFFSQIIHMDPKHISTMYMINIIGIAWGVGFAAFWMIKKNNIVLLWLIGFISLLGYHLLMFIMMHSTGNAYYYYMPLLLHGIGIGLIMVPTIMHCISAVPYYLSPAAAAFCLVVRYLGYASSSILTNYFSLYHYQIHYNNYIQSYSKDSTWYQNLLVKVCGNLRSNGYINNDIIKVGEQLLKRKLDDAILMRSIMDYYSIMMYVSIVIIIAIIIYYFFNRKSKLEFRPIVMI